MPIDLDSLWDFAQTEASEQRLRSALEKASGDDVLILQTQIARTFGLRREFGRARQILAEIEREVAQAGPEARVRHALETGRTWASAAHPSDSQTDDAKEQARAAYVRAYELAQAEGLDELAIDALHMLAFVDTAPADQLKWGEKALAIVEASSQPAAKKWEASLRHNIGYALHQLERYEDALEQFQKALNIRERGTDAEANRVARWMVAWTLRALDRSEEALALQLRLEQECAAAGAPDPYVFEELEILYRTKGEDSRAGEYAQKRKALTT